MKKINNYILEKFKISKNIKNDKKNIHSYEGIVDIVKASVIHCQRDKIFKQANSVNNTKKSIYLSKIDVEYISKLLKNTFDYNNLDYDMSLYTYIQSIIKINKENIEKLLNGKYIIMRNIDNPKEKFELDGYSIMKKYNDIISKEKDY